MQERHAAGRRTRNIVGPRVREARHRHAPRLTQMMLAARLQVAGLPMDRVMVAKIESGYREVTDYEVVAIASALGVPAAWLLGEVASRRE
jgi:transcriptional regulator with XRE-family HTH domain